MNKSKRRLLWAVGLPLSALVPLVLLGRLKQAYDYSHVPYRTAIVPRPYPQLGQSVQGLAFSPNGKTLFATDTQMGVSLWHLPRLVLVRRFASNLGDRVSCVFWSRDGDTVVVGDGSAVHRWDVNQDSLLGITTPQQGFRRGAAKKDYSDVSHIASPSGNLGAGANAEGDIIVWNLQTSKPLFFVNALPLDKNGYPTDFCDVAFSPNERQVATTSLQGDNPVQLAPVDIRIRETATGRILRQWRWDQGSVVKTNESSVLGGTLGYTGLTFSPDGKLLATADDVKVALWNARSGMLRQVLAVPIPSDVGGYAGPKKLVFFDRGRLLAGTGWGGLLPVWDVQTGALLQTFQTNADLEALAVSPDSRLLATAENGGGRLELWDVSRLLR